MNDVSERSMVRLTDEHLERLAGIGLEVFETLLAKPHVKSRVYKGRLLLIALCQGSGLHFIDGQNGVKDLDLWGFFAAHPDLRFPYRSYWRRDFGPSTLGRHPFEPNYQGRRVDVLGRSLAAELGSDGIPAAQRWLTARKSASAYHLAQKGVVAVWPPEQRGQVVWPLTAARA